MRKTAILLALVLAVAAASPAGGEEPPVLMKHVYQGYTTDGQTYALTFDLTVENPTAIPLYDVEIDTDPTSWLVSEPAPRTVGDLAPGELATVTVTLVTEWLPTDRELNELPLLWKAEASDASGQLLVTLAASHPALEGGAP